MNKLRLALSTIAISVLVSCGGPKPLVYDVPTDAVKADDFLAAMESSQEQGNTFEFSGKASYDDGKSALDFGYTIRLKRDSVIWVDITDPFVGLKIARAVVFPDSAAFYNRMESNWMAGGIDLIQEKIKLNLEFNHLQNVLLGEPMYIPESVDDIQLEGDSGIVRVKVTGLPNDSLFHFGNPIYEYAYGYVPSLPLIGQYVPDGPRSTMIRYSYSEDDAGIPRKINVNLIWNGEVQFEMRHNTVSRNVDLHMPFTIPNGYTRVQ